jgi:hypothetical protein
MLASSGRITCSNERARIDLGASGPRRASERISRPYPLRVLRCKRQLWCEPVSRSRRESRVRLRNPRPEDWEFLRIVRRVQPFPGEMRHAGHRSAKLLSTPWARVSVDKCVGLWVEDRWPVLRVDVGVAKKIEFALGRNARP